ncbi:MAG: hypothetical protein WB612_12140, partial [Nitrososphaeraceae archaeon]
INTKVLNGELPHLSYRISADYGTVKVASFTSPFFNEPNFYGEMNKQAPANGIIISQGLYQNQRETQRRLLEVERTMENVHCL